MTSTFAVWEAIRAIRSKRDEKAPTHLLDNAGAPFELDRLVYRQPLQPESGTREQSSFFRKTGYLHDRHRQKYNNFQQLLGYYAKLMASQPIRGFVTTGISLRKITPPETAEQPHSPAGRKCIHYTQFIWSEAKKFFEKNLEENPLYALNIR